MAESPVEFVKLNRDNFTGKILEATQSAKIPVEFIRLQLMECPW